MFSWQYWIETGIGPILQQYICILILIYVMSLLFSFEELFGATPDDEIIQLTKSEIDLLKAKIESKKAFEEVKEPTRPTN